MKSFNNLYIIKHAVIEDALTHPRDKDTSLVDFRTYSDKICYLLFSSAVGSLNLKDKYVTTPITQTKGLVLSDDIVIIPILRAGLAMLFAAKQLLPNVKVGLIGLVRDEKTAQASEYYFKIPQLNKDSVVIITDPMLATGGTLIHALKKISDMKCKKIMVVSVISAPEGIENITKNFPNVEIYTGALDQKLNSQKYIVPGLGDYGDRYFGV